MAGRIKVDQITNLNETGYILVSNGTSLDISQSTSGLVLPQGTTEERPVSSIPGSLRYNTQTKFVEYYDGTDWVNTDGSITIVRAGDTKLVYVISDSGSSNISSPTIRDTTSITTSDTGVSLVPYTDFNSQYNWRRAIFTSVNKPYVRWTIERSENLEKVLSAILSPYSNWGSYVSVNGTVPVQLGPGSSIGADNSISVNFQHNNGGGEPFDIPTLGNSGTVWSSGMYWGQIDAPSNYGGFLNTVNPHSGSGGGSTGDRLLIYLDTSDTPVPSQFVNYLTPNGPFGNATTFTWSNNGTSGLGGTPSNVANAIDRDVTTDWPSYGFQQQGNDSWIQVILPSAQSFDYTFAIGYPNGSHWSNQNIIQASNDGSTWTTMAEWTYHNGSSNSHGYLYFNSGSHLYTNTINNITKWIPIDNTKAFKYWRLRGTNFSVSNGYQLVMNWALLKQVS